MPPLLDGTTLFLFLLLAILATEPWRHLGVIWAGKITPDSQVLQWVRAISTALIAALIVRLVINPAGPLAETSLTIRCSALLFALATYYLCKQNLLLAITGGALTVAVLMEVSG